MRDWEAFVREHLALPELSPEREARIVRELAGQLEDFYRDARSRGLSEAEADAHARRQIRDWTGFASEVRQADRPNVRTYVEQLADRVEEAGHNRRGRWTMFADLMQDVRYALRQLRRSPGFTTVAVLTLALGIGANSAIFSILYAVALRPLPYRNPERLVVLRGSALKPDNWTDWRSSVASFSSFLPYSAEGVELTGVPEPANLRAMLVSAGYFSSLGTPPIEGRGFLAEEDRPGGPPVAVLGDKLWRQQFAADPNIVGRAVVLDGIPHTVVGVVPAETASTWQVPYDIWLPYGARQPRYTYALAYLKAGAELTAARAELQAFASRFPVGKVELRSMPPILITPLALEMVSRFQTTLMVLVGAAGFAMLIVCANLSHLLLARTSARQREFTLRSALGASRGRIFRQVLVESLLLAAGGAVLGIIVAVWGRSLLVALIPYSVNRLHQASVNLPVIVFTVLLAAACTFLFAFFPARAASRPGPTNGLSGASSAPAAERSKGWFVSCLTATEVALALVLVIGGGLLLKTYLTLRPSDPGFAWKNRLTFRVELSSARYAGPNRQIEFLRLVQERLRAGPRVEGVGMVNFLPFTGRTSFVQLYFGGREILERRVHLRVATPEFHRVMEIPVVQGRGFLASDNEQAPRVALVNETLARKLWPDGRALGKRIGFRNQGQLVEFTIAGVLGDTRIRGSFLGARGELTVPYAQLPQRFLSFVIHTRGGAHRARPLAHAAVRAVDPNLPLRDISSMEETLYESVSEQRFHGFLVGAFAAASLVLALVGVYGLLAYSIGRRTREIGIRMALGAQPEDILRLVLRQGLGPAAVGIILGLIGALGLTRFLRSALYGTSPTDLQTFVAVPLAILAVAGIACWIPARRATRVDPIVALRHE